MTVYTGKTGTSTDKVKLLCYSSTHTPLLPCVFFFLDDNQVVFTCGLRKALRRQKIIQTFKETINKLGQDFNPSTAITDVYQELLTQSLKQ